jgi:CDP-diacylglycerol--serine O-phosphatidyltransferase
MTDVVETRDAAPEPTRTSFARLLVPNAVTTASLLVAIVAALRALDGAYVEAGWLLVTCALLDKLDGSLARALSATSRFGRELDSLVDFVAFGVVPALLVHRVCTDPSLDSSVPWQGSILRRAALDAAVVTYVVCTALRLARFNVIEAQRPSGTLTVFWGLPSTFAGGVLSLWVVITLQRALPAAAAPLPLALFILAALMLSNVPLPKLQRRRNPWIDGLQLAVGAIAITCGLLRVLPELLLVLAMLYGILGFAWGLRYRPAAPSLAHDHA